MTCLGVGTRTFATEVEVTLTFGGCGTSEEWHVNYVAGHRVNRCWRLLNNRSRPLSNMLVLFVDLVTRGDVDVVL